MNVSENLSCFDGPEFTRYNSFCVSCHVCCLPKLSEIRQVECGCHASQLVPHLAVCVYPSVSVHDWKARCLATNAQAQRNLSYMLI